MSESRSPYPFRPVVPSRTRHDGWTPERQRAFVTALLATGSVAAAAKRVGMSSASAYRLRKRPGAKSFAGAWDHALAEWSDRAFDTLMERVRDGVAGVHFYRGRYTGHTHRYDDRDLIAALAAPRRGHAAK